MFPDYDVILNSIVSLAVVLAPIEVIIATKAIGIWRMLGSFKVKAEDPDFQKAMMRNVGQGVGAGLLERLGAAKGGATRTMQAGLQEGLAESVDMGAMEGLSQLIPRKYQKQFQALIGGWQLLQQMRGQGGAPGLPFLGGQQASGQNGQPQ